MSTHVSFLLLGLANGAVYAALGLALVVTHRSAKVLNLAVSAIALFTGTIYSGFRQGDLLLPLPKVPTRIHISGPQGFALAALLAMVVTAGVGLLLYVLVFRPLRAAPAVATAVASLGLSVIFVGAISQKYSDTPSTTAPFFPKGQYTFGGIHVSKDRVLFALTIVLIALAMWAIWRFTRFGLISRAVSQNEKGAFVVGIPVERVAAANWMISAMVSGAAGILMSPIVAPLPINYALFIVPALAVATLGGFERLAPAVLGGLAVGMLQSEGTYLQTQWSWLPSSGTQEFIPLLLILIVFVARARPLPSRGAFEARRLGRAPRPHDLVRTTVVSSVLAVVGLVALPDSYKAALIISLVFALISLSQVVVTGYAGQISLAQLTFAGVAGFLLGKITTDWHLSILSDFPVAPLLAGLGAALLGVLFALPAIRIRGLPVAVVTLALAVFLEAVWFRNTDIVTSSGQPVASPRLFGLDLGIGSGVAYPRLSFGLVVLIIVVLSGIGVARLRTSRLGAAMLAVRANEKAAAASGISVVRTKLAAFALGAFLAGMGGSLLAYAQGNVTYTSFTAYAGLTVFATAYLGGITSVSGAMLAGMLAVDGLLTKPIAGLLGDNGWYAVLAGMGLVYTAIANPEGIVGPIHTRIRDRRLARLGASAPAVAPAPHRQSSVTRAVSDAVVLSLRNVGVSYGGVRAVNDVSVDVREATIVGLIGPNGAGKTTLLDAISGFVPSDGQVLLGDAALHTRKPNARADAGLGRTFQSIELYDDLTVLENVTVGQATHRARASADPGADLQRTFEVLGLSSYAERPASELSQGTRQLVSIARAAAGQPRVLLLDEPAAGLDSIESQRLGQRLRSLRDSGMTIVIVDHDLHLILDLCDEIHVLDFGELIASGRPDEVRNDPKVKAAYIGASTGASDEPSEANPPRRAAMPASPRAPRPA